MALGLSAMTVKPLRKACNIEPWITRNPPDRGVTLRPFIPTYWLLDETRKAMDRQARTLRPTESIRVRNPVMTP